MNPQLEVILSVLAYSLCSGTLVLLNKLTLHYLPFPSLVVCIQLVATLTFIYGAKLSGILAVDPIRWKFVVPYLYYIVLFSMGVYCNMKSLTLSNVETVIVFRALSPCVVAFLDAFFLGREMPSLRSWTAMGTIVLGAYAYASFDVQFKTQGWHAYAWPFVYLLIISLEMTYGKKITQSVEMKTLGGPVLYTNLLGLPPMFAFAMMGSEVQKFDVYRTEHESIPAPALIFLALGCVAGTAIGYSSWWCRHKISATSFTLVGVINKCLTILLNTVMWDKHAPPGGIIALLVCLAGGTFYQQSPMRKNPASVAGKDTETGADVELAKEVEPLVDGSQSDSQKQSN